MYNSVEFLSCGAFSMHAVTAARLSFSNREYPLFSRYSFVMINARVISLVSLCVLSLQVCNRKISHSVGIMFGS